MAKKKDSDSPSQILKSVILGVAEDYAPTLPDWIKECKTEYTATKGYSNGQEGTIKIYYVTARIARHFQFNIDDSAIVRVNVGDTFTLHPQAMTQYSADEGINTLGHSHFELADPHSIQELSRYIRSVEYVAAVKDRQIQKLNEENECLKQKLQKLQKQQ